MKTCYVCKETKPASEFYKKRRSLEYRCKSCKKLYAQSHKVKIAKRMQAYYQSHKIGAAKRSQEYRQRYPKKCKARSVISVAVKTGRLLASIFCESCGLPAKTEGHHADYNRPLKVDWLCKHCHKLLGVM